MQASTALRHMIWERDGGVCGICGAPVAFGPKMHIDRVDASIRGYDDPNNLRVTHGTCNLKKGTGERRYIAHEPPARFTVVLPPALYDKIKATASSECRSAHKQIIYILERFYLENESRRAPAAEREEEYPPSGGG